MDQFGHLILGQPADFSTSAGAEALEAAARHPVPKPRSAPLPRPGNHEELAIVGAERCDDPCPEWSGVSAGSRAKLVENAAIE